MADLQAGGHEGAFSSVGEGRIQKKVHKSEFSFYNGLEGEYNCFKPFVPKCFDTKEEDGKYFIVMEDLTNGMKEPCIMDLKIGTSSAGEDVAPEKAKEAHARDKATTTAELGVRVVAINFVDHKTNERVKHSKPYGKKLTKDNIQPAIMDFFGTEETKKRILPSVVSVLESIRTFMESQTVAKIYSSSILIIYDASSDVLVPRTRMIDFAHVIPLEGKGRDEEYIVGINNLIKFLTE